MDIGATVALLKPDSIELNVGEFTLIVRKKSAWWSPNQFKTKMPKSMQYIFSGPEALEQAIKAYERRNDNG